MKQEPIPVFQVTLWGTGKPLREFLWSEDMADASVHVLLNVDFKDIIGIEKYSSVHYGVAADGVVDRNHSTGRGGYIPSLGEIRNRDSGDRSVSRGGMRGQVELLRAA